MTGKENRQDPGVRRAGYPNEKKSAGPAAARDTAGARRYIRDRYSPGRLGGGGAAGIKNVLVIQSASRSGSSFLYRLLSGLPGVLSLNGEDIVFHKLNGIAPVSSSADSDAVPAGFDPGPAVLGRVAEDILLDAGRVRSGDGPFSAQNYAADCAQRFLLQWPGAGADPDLLYGCAAAAVYEWRGAPAFETQLVWASFLKLLAGRGVAVNPWYYDLRPEFVRRLFPGSEPLSCPPPGGGLEDPPFVVPEPRSFPGAAGGETLLLKSSSNCYRAGFLKKLFPAARFRFVRLSRNPMAAISGLMDGWLSRGFFSRDLAGIAELDIKGYSVPEKPWTRSWWKFDLPPGWAEYRGKALPEVCAFQWLSANRSIFADASAGLLGKTIGVRYEDLLEPVALGRELERIREFAGLPEGGSDAARRAAPVMAVTNPRPHKWLKRKDELLPFCSSREVAEISSELGYDLKSAELLP